MSLSHSELTEALEALLPRVIDDWLQLLRLERLSGGRASIYRIVIQGPTENACSLCAGPQVRRAENTAQHPGLAVEAKLMQVARDHGVPEPEVFHVLQPEDGSALVYRMAGRRGPGARTSKPQN